MVGEILAAAASPTSRAVKRVLLTGPLSGLRYLAEFQAAVCAPLRVEVSRAREATLMGIARAAAFGLGGDVSRAASRWAAPSTVVRPNNALVREAADRQQRWMRLYRLARRLGDGTERGQ